jgi:hypothetical protein
MVNRDWSMFTQRININAPLQNLYDAFATRTGMESWFLRMCEYQHADYSLLAGNERVNAGDIYKWLWHGWPDTTAETGNFLKATGWDELQFTFGRAGIVRVKIFEVENEAIVELTQENIPSDEDSKFNFYVGCSTGWVFYLTNLKSIMEGGVDLRNKNVNLQRMLNA